MRSEQLVKEKTTREEMIVDFPYMANYDGIDFRKNPELYVVGKGEQGVLMAEPYKSEIGPHWRFRTPAIAEVSALTILSMFEVYINQEDFVGADMARKYLMMGWTRSRRYANHPTGVKFLRGTRIIKPRADDCMTNEKAECARIFKRAYDKARTNVRYLKLKELHEVLCTR